MQGQVWPVLMDGLQQVLNRWEGPCRITQAEKNDPKLIPYWRTPHQLTKKPTKSQEYLKYLNTWIYGDISAQAHLSFGGTYEGYADVARRDYGRTAARRG